MGEEGQFVTIYTIVYTAADSDNCKFHNPEARGSYLSLASAQQELERQIAGERATLDSRYDCEEQGDGYWEMYQDGYAAACFSRIEILEALLYSGKEHLT